VSRKPASSRANQLLHKLRAAHPDAHCELDHRNPFELLVATVLSARNTDVMVNQITPAFFARWPDAAALATAELGEVEQALGRLGMFRQKAKHVVGLAAQLLAEHSGQVPASLEALVKLSGVGRKTANVVLGVAFGAPEGVVVDTHVQRLAQRLGLSRERTADKIEVDLMNLFAQSDWDILAHTLIFHGRRICTARKPACAACPVAQDCPSAFDAETVGRALTSARPRARRASSKKTPARSRKRPSRPSGRQQTPAGRPRAAKRSGRASRQRP
jgi:endonuclease-3